MNCLITFLILTFAELAYFGVAMRFNITDRPNYRSSHKNAVIRGGGIIFPLAVFLYAASTTIDWLWVVGLFAISVISFWDDIFTLSSKVRFIVHLVAVSFLLFSLGVYDSWSPVLIVLAYILIIGTINAWNFMDGVNGITALYALSVLIVLWYLNKSYVFVDPLLIYIVGISVFIFMLFNFRTQAVCFAGDVGSISIAFILIFLILLLIIKTENWIFVLLFSVYGIDSVMTICYRLYRRENIFQAHRSHLYQLMANECRFPHLLVSCIYFVFQMSVDLIIIGVLRESPGVQFLIALAVLLALIIVYLVMRNYLMQKCIPVQGR